MLVRLVGGLISRGHRGPGATTALVTGLVAMLVLLIPASAFAPADPSRRAQQTLDGRYIVVYKSSVDAPGEKTDKLERAKGFKSSLRYGRALKGFAAKLSPGQVRALRADPTVASVAPDRPVKALGSVPLVSGEPTPPPGLRRIGAATTSTTREASAVNVAVIDTGVDLDHPDLNATGGKNCVSAGASADDDNGHGTHVAGTIAAENDGSGLVGVAPGSKVFAAKVLDGAGSGTTSQVICGIDWVTSTQTDSDPANDISVANMSLGGTGPSVQSCATTTDPQHKAMCNSTARGVTYVVAAGNDGWDFDYAPQPNTPAAYPEALTVAAMGDSDGQPGGTGGDPVCRTGEADDRYASFSNYAATAQGEQHTIAAPGVCIRSTAPGGAYQTMSGTSMATPHVAGAVALCLEEGGAAGACSELSPAQIVEKFRADAASRTTADPGYGFAGDPTQPLSGKYFGYLTWAGTGTAPRDTTPPDTSITSGPSGTIAQTSASFGFASTESGSSFKCKLDAGPWESCSSPKSYASLPNGGHSVSVQATDAGGNADATPATRTFTVDATAPTARPPAQFFLQPSQLGTSTVPVSLSWPAGSDNATSSTALKYDVEQKTNTGTFTPIASNTTALSITRSLVQNSTYQYRVRSRDAAGNPSAWATAAAFKPTPYQETSTAIAYTGTWKRTALSGAFGGYVNYTSAASARATLTFTGKNVAVVMPKRSGLGSAQICIDSASCSTVSLGSATSDRQVVYRGDGLSTATHKVTVTRASGRVDLDGFVALR